MHMLYRKNHVMLEKKIIKKNFIKSKFFIEKSFSQNFRKISVVIPSKWALTIVKDLKNSFYTFYLTSLEYYFKFAIPYNKTRVFYCLNTNSVTLASHDLKTLSTKWSKDISLVLYLFSSFSFLKLKFKGKGYYIYKNLRNTIAPQFGYYHKIHIYSYFNRVKFLSKTKILLFGLVKQDILLTAHQLKSKRSINIFTGRGVRFAKQIIYKKTGKVSSYR